MILLAEDDPNDELLTVRALKKLGIGNEIEVVRDGAETLEFLFATGQHAGRDPADLPQVLLLDLKLPKVSGLEVLQKLRGEALTKWLPVVVLTSSSLDKDMVESYRLGANSFVQKPVNSTEFSEAVRNLGLYWYLINRRPNGKQAVAG